MKHHKLYHENLDRTQSIILFKKNTKKSHCLHFDDFCRVLFDLAACKYPWEKNRSISIQQYVREEVTAKGLYDRKNKFE